MVRTFVTLPERVYRHLHFKGVFTIHVDEDHSFRMMHYGYQLENEIFWVGIQGGWEKLSMHLWIELCKQSSVIFDVGANTGIYALVAKSLNPTAKVYALEPVERVYKKLVDNNELNHFDVHCLQVAASDFTGKAHIYDIPAEHVYSVSVNKNLNSESVKSIRVEIEPSTLESLIDREHIPMVDLMKIDVETHEAEVLTGYKKYLHQQPSLLIEILSDEIGERVEKIISECGCNYLFFNIDEKTGIRRVPHITRSDGFNYLLCTPVVANKLGLVEEKLHV